MLCNVVVASKQLTGPQDKLNQFKYAGYDFPTIASITDDIITAGFNY